ncbi:MAG: hypothetical protein HZB56_13965 [Deltaproteobacteria bacterium]|nr:hypothetical protein [Deltaproteobacteria bacterium]
MRNLRILAILATVGLVASGCKGDKGDPGAPGGNGNNGNNGQNALVLTADEAPGANCAAGGRRVQSGVDANNNGAFDTGETSTTFYVCNGAAGSNGAASLVATSNELAGPNCPGGGVKIDSGLDANANGTLDVAEITATRYACNGVSSLVEGCAGCHNATLPTKHALTDQVVVSNVAIAESNANADLTVTFNVQVDGVNRNDFTHLVGVYSWVWSAGTGTATRTTLTTTTFTLTPNFSGNYTLVMPGYGTAGATPAVFDSTSFLIRVDNGATAWPVPTILAHYTTGNVMAGVPLNNQACKNCHGERVFRAGHHGADPVGVEACAVCHDRDSSAETRLVATGTRLMGYVHGIHNSHNMPGAVKLDGTAVDGGVYYRNFNGTTGPTSTFSIGFPGYMNNCSTCHLASALPTLAATPVSWRACMSCHAGPPAIVTPGGTTAEVAAGFTWAGFGVANTGTAAAPIFSFGGTNHAPFTAATNCATCHDGTIAPATLASFHNGLLTERSGLLWDGVDQSVALGATVDMQITGVSFSGTNMVVTWTAAVNGAPVDPCNATFASGPVFFGNTGVTGTCNNTPTGCASNLSILRAYAQGNDWVNAGVGTSPGQPASAVNVTATNTVCAGTPAVATTTIATGTTFGTKGVVAIQGKPQMIFPGTGNVIQVRAKSPTREFAVADGALPAAASLRRAIVNTDKCDACHKGTLYQHGGNRVDNVDLCVMCHNPAANEGNNRVNMGVTAAEAYDGKVGETYDMRNMVHAIHSAGESGAPLVYYRTNGVYFFGTKAALAKVTNWPGTGCQIVAGSGAPSAATGTQCDTTNTTAVTKNHNFIEVHYPRALNECYACHDDTPAGPGGPPRWVISTVDPTKAVAVTVAPGASSPSQLDDVLQGPNATSCMSCHQSGDFVTQFGLRMHAYDQGWTPSIFTNGRQTLIDAIRLP